MPELVGNAVKITLSLLAVVFSPSLLADTSPPAPPQQALLNQYCTGCHNQKLKTGGVSLDHADVSRIGEDAGTWERVLRKMRADQMPPPGMPRPTPAQSAAFTKWLETSLDEAAIAKPNPGRTGAHRLNRAEYSNAVRDVLALDTKPGNMLPVDDSGFGFDNIANLLSMSPALLERYMSTARVVSRMAVGDPTMKPVEDQFTAPKNGSGRAARNESVSGDLPFDSRGGLALNYYFPVDAEYIIRIKATGTAPAQELRLPVKAGLHPVGVTFLRESAKPEIATVTPRRGGGGAPAATGTVPPAQMDLRLDGSRLKLFDVAQGAAAPEVDTVTILGPYNVTGRGDTPSRERIFVCRPVAPQEESPCAKTILMNLTRRAFRRPVNDADLRPLMVFYQSGRSEGDFDHGIEKALRAMLISPDFLFRVEQDPAGLQAGAMYRVSDYELASRLSFFLWSSVPDDELLKLASQSKLKDPAVLDAQVHRMLDDPRSDSLVSNFGGQWLYLRNLATVKPDQDLFPEFDESLRRSFRAETDAFLSSIFRDDRPVTDLLSANYTFLNQRLAEHYGVPSIYGSQLRRVTLTDPNRSGLLGQGSILTVTSYPNRTSVVQRGKWVLENLLGSPPPPPPPDIPELKAHANDGRKMTMREQMQMHRANPICTSCHSRMDPIGFALENYDGVGKWRSEDDGSKIDASGKLPGGESFEGPAGLKKTMLSGHREEFINTVTEKLLTYALGRGLEPFDQPVVRSITRQAGRDDYRISALVAAVVQSTPFQMRRTPDK